jgi:hypothetical protein
VGLARSFALSPVTTVYSDWAANAIVAAATIATVMAVVLIHYEGLFALSRWLASVGEHPRRRKVLYGVTFIVVLHLLEILVFGLVLWGLVHVPNAGAVVGQYPSHLAQVGHVPLHLFDAVYLSAMSYTTVGFGDVVPIGPIRLLTGTEALLGLVLIGWSASFTYLEMERYWRVR